MREHYIAQSTIESTVGTTRIIKDSFYAVANNPIEGGIYGLDHQICATADVSVERRKKNSVNCQIIIFLHNVYYSRQDCTLNKLNNVWFFVKALHLFKLLLIIKNNCKTQIS